MIYWYFLTVICLTLADRTIAAVVSSCADDQDTRYCINDEVQHQCTAPPSLVWRVLDDQDGPLGAVSYTGFEALGVAQSIPGAGDFSVALISDDNPLVSNISFNASISLNGYTIQCLQAGGPNRTCNITIADPPSRINDLMMSSCTSTSVQLSWTDNSPCITNYIINSTTSDSPITTSTTDTSYALDISSLSGGVYYISVAGVDTGGRTGQHSNMVSVTINVPPTVNFTYTPFDGEGDTVIIQLSWTVDEVCPPISSYYITSGDTTISVPSGATVYTIYGVSNGTSVTVFAGNVIGNGTKVFEIIDIPDEPLPPLPTPTPSSTATMATTTPSETTDSRGGGLGAGAIAGIIVGAIIGLVLAIVIVIVVIFCVKVYCCKNSTKPDESQMNYADLEMSKPGSSKKASKRKQEAPPPQDNSAVEYSAVSHVSQPKDTEQTFYADLALDSNTPEPKSRGKKIEYADIRQQQSS